MEELIKDVDKRTTAELRIRLRMVEAAIKELQDEDSNDILVRRARNLAKRQRRALKKVINERTGEGPPPDTKPLKVQAKVAQMGAKGRKL